jgi:PPOX class probable F420-dependent enzyme
MTPAERLDSMPVARLATADAAGVPHLVPFVFAVASDPVAGDTIYSAVDHKPKRTRALRRLADIAVNPRVSVLADHYEDDWSRLWWVRADGTARVLDASPEALAALRNKYEQYREIPPAGPFLVISVARWTQWAGR